MKGDAAPSGGPAVTRALHEAQERQRRPARSAPAGRRKRAGRRRERTALERLRLHEAFLSHVSHELRTPLASVHQFTTLLLDGLGGDLSPKAREYLEIILRNAEQLRRMIGDLLTLTRCGSGKLILEPASASLAELIQHACRSLEATAMAGGVSLSSRLPAHLPAVYMDAARIHEVLINLVDNAIKFTPRGGEVVVRARTWNAQPGFVRVSVSDTGHGIRPENAKRVFERFYQVPNTLQSSRCGLGLGLHISRELVKAHGGAMGLKSNAGQGTTVWFTLPILSLAAFILPLLTPANLEKDSIALLTIKLRAPEGLAAVDAAQAYLRASELLKRCIRAGSDILLPRSGACNPGFHLLEFANATEAGSISSRIRRELSSLQTWPQDSVEVHSATIALPPGATASPLETANQIARRVERQVKNQSLDLQHSAPEVPRAVNA